MHQGSAHGKTRPIFIRLLAGILALLMLAFTPAIVSDAITNWRSAFKWFGVGGLILCLPVFSTYAFLGERRANRVLVAIARPLIFIATLRERIFHVADREIQKRVVMPEELRDEPRIQPPTARPS